MFSSVRKFLFGESSHDETPPYVSESMDVTPESVVVAHENSDVSKLTRIFDILAKQRFGKYNYHKLTSAIDLMIKIVVTGDHYKLLPFLEKKSLISVHLS